MLRKIFLILIIGCIVLATFFIFTQLRQKSIISNTLSERSLEFIKGQKFVTNSSWSNLNLKGPVREDTRGKRIEREDKIKFQKLLKL